MEPKLGTRCCYKMGRFIRLQSLKWSLECKYRLITGRVEKNCGVQRDELNNQELQSDASVRGELHTYEVGSSAPSKPLA